ncbi:MAG TPA: DinB family protein [Candidatus Cybelea sp.]|nr:DinB family protein [Candidatus Cybelea sp.]
MKRHFEMLAAYNVWANERLYDAAAAISDAEYRKDRGAFFGSLHGTLNHLLLGDIIWMHRFTGEGEEPSKLDAILHDDLAQLRAARRREDVRIEAYIRGLDDAALAGTITYRTTRNPTEIEQELAPLLIHFFNHQTHHRGQAHCLLTAINGEAPSFDLLVYQRQTGISIRKGAGGQFAPTEKRPG